MSKYELFNSLRAALQGVEEYLWEDGSDACVLIPDGEGGLHCPGCTLGTAAVSLLMDIDDYLSLYPEDELDKP